MRLFLVRHGLAEDVGPDGTDATRRLTADGRRRMRAAAAGLQALGLRPDALLTSPLPRALDTAEIIGTALGQSPQSLAALGTDSSAPAVVRALAAYQSCARVIVVGHEPTLSEIVALLVTGTSDGMALRFKQGTCVALALRSLLPPGSAVLRWMLTARQLGHVGRHEPR